GTDAGLFQYQPGTGDWYAYAAGDATEQAPDWVPLAEPAEASGADYLPAVLAVHRGPDASLWLGTARGIARYVAHPDTEDTLAYQTYLEAFPDLTDGPVVAIREDERG